jgi:nitroreductase
MTVSEALNARRATPFFDPSQEISLDTLKALIDQASLSPTSMNLQPYNLLVVHSAEEKARLVGVSYNQTKIADASAAVVVVGLTNGHELHAERVSTNNVDLGYMPEDRKQGWIDRARGGWPTEQKQRDEAFRAGSLWAMSFMLVAQEAGWVTAPMGGFVEDALRAEFGLPETAVPVLIIAIGKPDPSKELKARGERFPADEIAHIGNW